MALDFSLVDGAAFAPEASVTLEEAWIPPALRYTPEYLRWQLSFPSPVEMPSVAAFEGRRPVGFAGTTARSMRLGSQAINAAVVSFVAVRPESRGRGVAAGLYRTLLQAPAGRDIPAIAYAAPASGGERAILRACPEAGFRMYTLGAYSNYAFAGSAGGSDGEWQAVLADDPGLLSSVTKELPSDAAVLWSMPDHRQLTHYLAVPRPRALIVVEHQPTSARGAGFVVGSEFRTTRGVTTVNTLDSVWLPRTALSGLHCLLRLACAWPASGESPAVVTCPNLSAFEPAALRSIGVRKTGAQFSGYFCSARQAPDPVPERTNLEIV